MIDLLELGRASRLGAILMLSFEATGDGVVQVVITGDDVDADVLSSQSAKLLGNVLVLAIKARKIVALYFKSAPASLAAYCVKALPLSCSLGAMTWSSLITIAVKVL